MGDILNLGGRVACQVIFDVQGDWETWSCEALEAMGEAGYNGYAQMHFVKGRLRDSCGPFFLPSLAFTRGTSFISLLARQFRRD